MRSVTVGRKNHLFVGSLTGGRAAALAYILIETAKLNGVDPQGMARRHSRTHRGLQDYPRG
ncbi:hypothetical protein LCGC14_1199090 [marine sediment metagenome]|uniref:Transposase IS66 C-terminal domain-containing protein n=1 Tax=marine sediment metagenome TaxID=412755 RepID=A0A0F9NZX3_9ZZZZ